MGLHDGSQAKSPWPHLSSILPWVLLLLIHSKGEWPALAALSVPLWLRTNSSSLLDENRTRLCFNRIYRGSGPQVHLAAHVSPPHEWLPFIPSQASAPPTPSKIFFNSHDIEKLKCRVMVHNCRWYASVLTFCVELVCQE